MSIDVVLATGNQNKVCEMTRLLAPLSLRLHPQSSFGVSSVSETGSTFVENALLKARHACQATGLPAIADDSGLVVPSLNGEPGILSSRYAGESATDDENNRKLIGKLSKFGDDHSSRHAYFVAVVVFLSASTEPFPTVCSGHWSGAIIASPRGQNGFGYDPHFLVHGIDRTAAELPAEEKNSISHRGQAVAKLVRALKETGKY